MPAPERMPMPQRTRQTVRKVATRGPLYDFLNFSTLDVVKYETDFLGHAIDTTNSLVAGGAGTAAALVTTSANGEINLVTTGSDNKCSILYLDNANWLGNNNPVLAVRLKVDSIATGNAMIGFIDNVAAGVMDGTGVGPFVSPLASPPTLVSTTADAIAFTYDLSSGLGTPTRWRVAYSRASTAAVVLGSVTAAAIAAPVASTYQTLVLALERSPITVPDMGFSAYINGVKVASLGAGAITGTAPLYPFVLIGATSAASRTMTVDYFAVWQDRVVTI